MNRVKKKTRETVRDQPQNPDNNDTLTSLPSVAVGKEPGVCVSEAMPRHKGTSIV